MKITDTTDARWPEMSKGDAEQNQKQKVLWFDTEGMGPSVHDWTVRAMITEPTDPEIHGTGVEARSGIGIEFSQLGGPYMDVDTARRLHMALGAALFELEPTPPGSRPLFDTHAEAQQALERCFGPLQLVREIVAGALALRYYRGGGDLAFAIATVDGKGSTCGVVTGKVG